MADRLRLGHGGAHRLGALFKFPANALAVDGFRVPIPCKSLHADLRDIAAKTAITFQQGCFDTRPRRCQSCGKATGAGTNDQNIGLADHINIAGGFEYRFYHLWASFQLGAT